jgi:hypothetical protein
MISRPNLSIHEFVLAQLRDKGKPAFTLEDWQIYADIFLELRRGLFEASQDESLVGYVDGFTPVYVTPWERQEGESWYVWFIFPGKGNAGRVVTEIIPGSYMDHAGTIVEHDPEWVMVLGTVTRKGNQPLISPGMGKGE